MRRYILDMLKELEAKVIPPANCHHAIVSCQFGSPEKGWTEQLAVQVNDGGKFYAYFLDDDDFEKCATELATDIASLHSGKTGQAQLGIQIGQFVE